MTYTDKKNNRKHEAVKLNLGNLRSDNIPYSNCPLATSAIGGVVLIRSYWKTFQLLSIDSSGVPTCVEPRMWFSLFIANDYNNKIRLMQTTLFLFRVPAYLLTFVNGKTCTCARRKAIFLIAMAIGMIEKRFFKRLYKFNLFEMKFCILFVCVSVSGDGEHRVSPTLIYCKRLVLCIFLIFRYLLKVRN